MLVMVDEPSNGKYYGSAVAAPVVSQALSEILPYLGYYAEYSEEDISNLDVNVPNVTGSGVASAKSTIEALELEYEIIGKVVEIRIKPE